MASREKFVLKSFLLFCFLFFSALNFSQFRNIFIQSGARPKVTKEWCHMLNESSEYNYGRWVKLKNATVMQYILTKRDMSDRARQRRCAKEEQRILSYTWKPYTCELPLLNSLMNEKLTYGLKMLSPFLFAGDSLLEQFYSSFADFTDGTDVEVGFSKNFLLVDPYSLKPVDSTAYNNCLLNRSLCPRGVNEYTNSTSYHRALMYFKWAKQLQTRKYKTLIFNTGHHWWKETTSKSMGFEPGTDAFKKYPTMVKSVAEFMRSLNFTGHVIYVTSPPGFHGCRNDLPPNIEPPSWKDTYSWRRPAQVEPHWEQIFRKNSPNTKFSILNITGLSVLRGDAHPKSDCLHYCQVGVPDEWSRILFYKLFQLLSSFSAD